MMFVAINQDKGSIYEVWGPFASASHATGYIDKHTDDFPNGLMGAVVKEVKTPRDVVGWPS